MSWLVWERQHVNLVSSQLSCSCTNKFVKLIWDSDKMLSSASHISFYSTLSINSVLHEPKFEILLVMKWPYTGTDWQNSEKKYTSTPLFTAFAVISHSYSFALLNVISVLWPWSYFILNLITLVFDIYLWPKLFIKMLFKRLYNP